MDFLNFSVLLITFVGIIEVGGLLTEIRSISPAEDNLPEGTEVEGEEVEDNEKNALCLVMNAEVTTRYGANTFDTRRNPLPTRTYRILLPNSNNPIYIRAFLCRGQPKPYVLKKHSSNPQTLHGYTYGSGSHQVDNCIS